MTNTKTFDDLIPHMKRAGFVATALAAVITAKFGWSLGEDRVAQFSLAGLLALCTFIVGYSLVAAFHAYERGMKSVGHASVALFGIAVCMEFLSHTGFTAANRDATIQHASLQTTAYADSRGNVDLWQATLKRLTDERSMMTPKRSAAEARAVIDRTEAHKLYRGATEGCKITKGPQSRALCDDYLNAKADLSLWDQISVQEGKLADAQGKLEQARMTAGAKTVDHASAASQGTILAAIATQEQTPTDNAVFWAGVGISALIALFAIAAGGLLNFIAWSFDAKGVAGTVTRIVTEAAEPLQRMTLADLANSQGHSLRILKAA